MIYVCPSFIVNAMLVPFPNKWKYVVHALTFIKILITFSTSTMDVFVLTFWMFNFENYWNV